jgi:hypothetical protein
VLKVAQRAILSEYSPFDAHFPARSSHHPAFDSPLAGRDCKIEGAQFGICDQPRGLDRCGWSEAQYGVIALAVGRDS